ncbi:MAG: type II toxin-antitoxin system PemK/MazF family toxin [Eubacterium sp.]|nr:type II toxin-antitoxin system PemK/MazF family toxin [Eubacterium sp.]
MYTKLQEMLCRNRNINKLQFDKQLKLIAEESGEEYSSLKAQNEIDTNKMVANLTHELTNTINELEVDVRIKLSQWLSSWIYYLSTEKDFDSNKLMTYKRGDIVHVNFGFNVHNELGGTHYAVVVENDNPSSNGTVTVVPLKSADTEEEAKSELHDKTEVYLGKGIVIMGQGKDKYTIAKVNQMRAIDKMRILKPRNSKKDIVYPIDRKIRNDMLNKIDQKIIDLYTKKLISLD